MARLSDMPKYCLEDRRDLNGSLLMLALIVILGGGFAWIVYDPPVEIITQEVMEPPANIQFHDEDPRREDERGL